MDEERFDPVEEPDDFAVEYPDPDEIEPKDGEVPDVEVPLDDDDDEDGEQ